MPNPRPEDLLDQPIPDVALPGSDGETLRFRGRSGIGPLVLFFYVRNASPG
jgi:peroxiredoxin